MGIGIFLSVIDKTSFWWYKKDDYDAIVIVRSHIKSMEKEEIDNEKNQ